ncbi:MAG: ATP synthase F0 subunit B [Deltaproteobacteria bacterium]|nr:ATP synthase F0 subunit B [Deltaproteobacteria bacterium]
MRLWSLLAAALFVTWPSMAFAAEGGFWKGVAWSAANFVILGAVLVVVLRKRVQKALADRRDAIASELGEAARLREEAAQKAADIEQKLAALDGEISKMIAEFRAEGERAKEKMIAEAKRLGERLAVEAESAIALDLEREKRALREELVRRAVAVAEEMLRQSATGDDQVKFARSYVEKFRAQVGGAK